MAEHRRTVAVTGVNGFVGRHVAADLSARGFSVFGISRDPEVAPEIAGMVSDYVEADLAAAWPTIPPVEAVIHLAGLAAVGASFVDPQSYISINSAMITHMGEHYLQAENRPRILGISSGAIYASAGKHALKENSPITISSPYVVSKLLIENQLTYYTNRGLDCIIARPFNHVGPGQGQGFLMADLVQQVSEAIEIGGQVSVGNLSTFRDYTDVRDVAAAYRLIATTPKINHRLYNVCSGRAVSGDQLLGMVRMVLGADSLNVNVDKSRLRPNDADIVIGDASRLHHDLGWSPVISLQQTIKDFVERR